MEKLLKVKKGFVLREVSGVFCVVAVGEATKSFKGAITLKNDTAVFIFKKLLEGITYNDLVISMTNEYEVTEDKAKEGIDKILNTLKQYNIIENEWG